MTAGVALSQTDAAVLAHPLTHFGFGALLAGAARPRPGALAFADRHDGARMETSYADLYQRVGACLARLRGFDLDQGENILICCPPGAQSFVTLAAALAGGLEPAAGAAALAYGARRRRPRRARVEYRGLACAGAILRN